jgi:hypothetical protein
VARRGARLHARAARVHPAQNVHPTHPKTIGEPWQGKRWRSRLTRRTKGEHRRGQDVCHLPLCPHPNKPHSTRVYRPRRPQRTVLYPVSITGDVARSAARRRLLAGTGTRVLSNAICERTWPVEFWPMGGCHRLSDCSMLPWGSQRARHFGSGRACHLRRARRRRGPARLPAGRGLGSGGQTFRCPGLAGERLGAGAHTHSRSTGVWGTAAR